MLKRYAQPITALCLLGIFLSPAIAQEESIKQEMVKPEVLKVGDKAPDFEVETLSGTKFKLSDRYSKDGKPTILLFSRASW